jgi:ABC-type iron transport system FetAB permease component
VNLDLRPFVALWIVVTAIVIVLFIWRKIVAGKEDDTLHVNSGSTTQQTVIAQKLDQIDKWGKIVTVLAVVLGILVAAAYVYGQFVGRASMGA